MVSELAEKQPLILLQMQFSHSSHDPLRPEIHFDSQYLALLNSLLSKHPTNVSELFLEFSGAK